MHNPRMMENLCIGAVTVCPWRINPKWSQLICLEFAGFSTTSQTAVVQETDKDTRVKALYLCIETCRHGHGGSMVHQGVIIDVVMKVWHSIERRPQKCTYVSTSSSPLHEPWNLSGSICPLKLIYPSGTIQQKTSLLQWLFAFIWSANVKATSEWIPKHQNTYVSNPCVHEGRTNRARLVFPWLLLVNTNDFLCCCWRYSAFCIHSYADCDLISHM